LALDEPKDSDSVFDYGGVEYIIDNDLLEESGAITIDFVVEGWQSGFTITPGKAVSGSCPVGGTCSACG
jgi:Fe-S cluster assembly iron-binding protein IscA